MPQVHPVIKPSRSSHGFHVLGALLCLALGSHTAQAQIDTSDNPNLFFTLTDLTTAQESYTLNLNLKAADFYINAQQDAGSYLFFTLDPSKDAALQAFVNAAGANLSTARWGVLGMTVPTSDSSQRVVYSTLTSNGDVATQTTNYDRLFKMNNGAFRAGTGLSSYITALNSAIAGTTIEMTTLRTATAPTLGSSLSSVNYPATYPNASLQFKSSDNSSDGDCIFGALCFGNPVGTSSWFYQTSVSKNASGGANGNLTAVSVNEFDNLTNDGYWGFTRNTNTGLYVLSYTLPGSNPKSLVSTDEGRTRLSFTDYAAQSGTARLITIDDGDIANVGIDAGAIAAVPEPQTWGLMALGGLFVATAARRRRANPVQGA